MNGNNPASPIAPEARKEALLPHLFAEQDEETLPTYAVLDGASIPDLLDHLYGDHRPEFECLYRGELAPDIAEVAPYLVRLEPEAPFTDWCLTEGWGNHWGIFARSRAGLKTVRTHFRKYLTVNDPAGNQIYFRFYDPRVLRAYLPTCNPEELSLVFGPITTYLCEDRMPGMILTFGVEKDQLKKKTVEIAPRGESV